MRCGIKAKLVTQGGKGGLGCTNAEHELCRITGDNLKHRKITSDETSKLIRNNASFLKI